MKANTNIIPRQTIVDIVNKRNDALQLIQESSDLLNDAYEKSSEAIYKVSGISTLSDFNTDRARSDENYGLLFRGRYNSEVSMKTAREIIDYDVWKFVISYTEIDSLMDKEAKDELTASLKDNVPEVTVDNIRATLETLYQDAYKIFLRGTANVFSKLDRRFKSHNAWKLGSRIILKNCFDNMGYWNRYRNHEATLVDVERVFSQLDTGEAQNTLINVINAARKETQANRRSWGEGHQTFLETDYFKIRIFINGNCHIWFKNPDLVTKVNKLIAEYYGDVIPDDTDQDFTEEVFKDIKTTPAKSYGFFPTPDALVDKIMSDIHLTEGEEITCLEPSAGSGQISKRAVGMGMKVDVVELQPHLVKDLRSSGLYETVYGSDFHKFDTAKRYDYIIMNPPFDRGRDIDHIMHAWKFLKEGGKLISIMHAGIEFSSTKKAKAFRKFAKDNGGRSWYGRNAFEDLPQNSFSSVGTNVNTVLCTLIK